MEDYSNNFNPCNKIIPWLFQVFYDRGNPESRFSSSTQSCSETRRCCSLSVSMWASSFEYLKPSRRQLGFESVASCTQWTGGNFCLNHIATSSSFTWASAHICNTLPSLLQLQTAPSDLFCSRHLQYHRLHILTPGYGRHALRKCLPKQLFKLKFITLVTRWWLKQSS